MKKSAFILVIIVIVLLIVTFLSLYISKQNTEKRTRATKIASNIIKAWEFNKNNDTEGWHSENGTSSLNTQNGILKFSLKNSKTASVKYSNPNISLPQGRKSLRLILAIGSNIVYPPPTSFILPTNILPLQAVKIEVVYDVNDKKTILNPYIFYIPRNGQFQELIHEIPLLDNININNIRLKFSNIANNDQVGIDWIRFEKYFPPLPSLTLTPTPSFNPSEPPPQISPTPTPPICLPAFPGLKDIIGLGSCVVSNGFSGFNAGHYICEDGFEDTIDIGLCRTYWDFRRDAIRMCSRRTSCLPTVSPPNCNDPLSNLNIYDTCPEDGTFTYSYQCKNNYLGKVPRCQSAPVILNSAINYCKQSLGCPLMPEVTVYPLPTP